MDPLNLAVTGGAIQNLGKSRYIFKCAYRIYCVLYFIKAFYVTKILIRLIVVHSNIFKILGSRYNSVGPDLMALVNTVDISLSFQGIDFGLQ